tara:strand:- start:446 stop:934 length:489 start_codon:yes stop_codon:yes gene_type:complete
MKYSSNLHFGASNIPVKASFKLIKTIHCDKSENVDKMVDKLDRLKKENFNRVLIPNFEYEVKNTDVIYTVDFIKGYGMGTLVPKYANIVYEDVVKRKSEWTFMDLHTVNFIVEYSTEKIYAIDFQSYTKVPDQIDRQINWDYSIKSDLDDLKKINQLLQPTK